jgi:hypothetical protein
MLFHVSSMVWTTLMIQKPKSIEGDVKLETNYSNVLTIIRVEPPDFQVIDTVESVCTIASLVSHRAGKGE